MIGPAIAGLAATSIALVLTIIKGIQYHRYLPKKEVHESLEALRERYAEIEERVHELRAAEAAAQLTIQKGEQIQSFLETTRVEVEELERKKRQLENIEVEHQRRTEELEQLRLDAVAIREEKASVDREIEEQRRQILSPEELQAEKERLEELRTELNRLTHEHDQLSQRLREVRPELAEAETRNAELRRDNAVLGEEVAQKTKAVEELKERLQRLEQTSPVAGVGDYAQRSALVWEPVLDPSAFHTAASPDLSESAALDDALGRIRERGLVYHDRVIKAFHTALKCSEESPLLVLAGISGTGKSALPAAYADVMGMHSLNIAVQPGWDSPADLLGFYNHLEQRFKPTELARALVQMDAVEREGDRPEAWSPLGDRMLLVLLDEMNLARVEYYFSEFLSRLEERRGVDPTDKIGRKRAELPLELGTSADKGEQSLPIFVGNNVLFVGTMNEDESTQTLSDKVIDRSNVMRFGKPASLRVDHGGGSPKRERTEAYLPESVWSKWRSSTGARPEAEPWIQEANEILALVGRPFAYRVAEGMRRYVSLYPDHTSEGHRHAMADQIELRILPRLRGLDLHDRGTSEALERVMKLVADLQDEPLAAALDDARNLAADQLFLWHGFDRSRQDNTVRV